jgi:hypothetical protein
MLTYNYLNKCETVSHFSRVQRYRRITVEKHFRTTVGLPGTSEIESGDTGGSSSDLNQSAEPCLGNFTTRLHFTC